MKIAIPFFFGGGGGGGWEGRGCQRKSKPWGRLCFFYIIDYQGQSKTNDIRIP